MKIINERDWTMTDDTLPPRKEKALSPSVSDSEDSYTPSGDECLATKLVKLSQSMKSCRIPLGGQKAKATARGLSKDVTQKIVKDKIYSKTAIPRDALAYDAPSARPKASLKSTGTAKVLRESKEEISQETSSVSTRKKVSPLVPTMPPDIAPLSSIGTERPATMVFSVPPPPRGGPPNHPTPTPAAVSADTRSVKAPPRALRKTIIADSGLRNSPVKKEAQLLAIDVSVGDADVITTHQKPDTSQSKLKRPWDDPTSNSSAVGSSSHNKRPKAAIIQKYSKHPVHWAPDGSALVQIKEVRFRLHRSRLEKLSDWFRNYFNCKDADANLGNAGETRVILLDNVGVELADFEVLLDALDNFVPYFYDKPSFGTVASILRASTKLSFNSLLTWSSQYLQDMWPTSLLNVTTVGIPFAAESLELARQCNIPSIQKRVMYELVRIEGFGQISGEDGQDGNPAARISPREFTALFRAREKLMSHWILSAGSPAVDQQACELDNTGCTSSKLRQNDHAHIELVHRSGIFQTHFRDPICGLQALVDAPWAKKGFCKQCVAIKKERWENAREQLWKNLDVWFGLSASAT